LIGQDEARSDLEFARVTLQCDTLFFQPAGPHGPRGSDWSLARPQLIGGVPARWTKSTSRNTRVLRPARRKPRGTEAKSLSDLRYGSPDHIPCPPRCTSVLPILAEIINAAGRRRLTERCASVFFRWLSN